MGKYSTERFISLVRRKGTAHSWCLMPHLWSKPVEHVTPGSPEIDWPLFTTPNYAELCEIREWSVYLSTYLPCLTSPVNLLLASRPFSIGGKNPTLKRTRLRCSNEAFSPKSRPLEFTADHFEWICMKWVIYRNIALKLMALVRVKENRNHINVFT